MLPLTFADKSDYDKVQPTDTVTLNDLASFAPGKQESWDEQGGKPTYSDNALHKCHSVMESDPIVYAMRDDYFCNLSLYQDLEL